MGEEIKSANTYGKCYQRHKRTNPPMAKRFYEMSLDELKHASYLHDMALDKVQEMEERDKSFADFLQDMWIEKDNEYMDHLAQIKTLLNMQREVENMTEQELHEYALRIANNRLMNEFDAEAYIVKCLAEQGVDKVPESDIDEQIDDINSYFVQYMKSRSDKDLITMLLHIRQMLSELYHVCNSDSQKEIFRNQISHFTNILNQCIL